MRIYTYLERLLYALKTKISKIIKPKACSPSTWEMEAGGSIVHGHCSLHGNFRTSLGYTTTYLKEEKDSEADFSIYKVIISYYVLSTFTHQALLQLFQIMCLILYIYIPCEASM